MTMTLEKPYPLSVGRQLVEDIRGASKPIWLTILAFLAFSILCVGFGWLDDRLLNGVSVWNKPAKFFLSLAVQFATVSWALTLLPIAERKATSMNAVMIFMVAFGWLEMIYIVFRAARGEASHFNSANLSAQVLYGVMGVCAVYMALTAGYVGLRLWRHRRNGLWTEAAALGLIAGTILGMFAGAYMSAQTSHWVGGATTDAGGLGFFSWSTTGGDLRVAHFVGMHAAQIIPLAALSGNRRMVYGTAALMAILTLGTFAMAISGTPLLRM